MHLNVKERLRNRLSEDCSRGTSVGWSGKVLQRFSGHWGRAWEKGTKKEKVFWWYWWWVKKKVCCGFHFSTAGEHSFRDPFFKKWDEVSVAFKEGCQDVVTINHAKEAFLHTREMHPHQHMTECSCHALGGVIGPHGANGKVGRRQLLMQSCVCAFIYFLLPVAYSLENSLENALCGEAGAWNY